jgi:HAD superfamily hydrolase (TIGR01509 family)
MITVALLDVDGTLVDSNDAHAKAWMETLAEFGRQVSFARIRELIGKGGDKLLPETIGIEKDSPEGKKISERRSALFREKYLPTLQAFPGARQLLKALRAQGLRLVVATSAQKGELQYILDVANVGDLIEEAATSGDAKDSKPDPDIVLAALRAAGCEPCEAVMLGDTPYDVEAATNAGVIAVALRCGGWDDEALKGAVAIYDDARDLLAHLALSAFVDAGAARATD